MILRWQMLVTTALARIPDGLAAPAGEAMSLGDRINATMGFLTADDDAGEDGGQAAPQDNAAAADAPDGTAGAEVANDAAQDADKPPADDPAAANAGQQPEQTVALPDGTQAKLSEVVAGYQRQADYSRKTMEVAAERRAVEAQKAELAQRAQELDAKLRAAAEMPAVDPQFMALSQRTQDDWIALARSDPAQWAADMATFVAGDQKRRAAQAEADTLRQQETARQEAERKQSLDKQVAAELASIRGIMPDLADDAKANAFFTGIDGYLTAQGYPAGTLRDVVDHRAWTLIDKARRWDAMEANRKAGLAKAAAAPTTPTVRPVAAAGGSQSQQQQLAHRARASGSLKDRFAAVEAMLR